MRAQMQAGKLTNDVDGEKMCLMQRLLRHRVFSTDDAMREHDIISESIGHL